MIACYVHTTNYAMDTHDHRNIGGGPGGGGGAGGGVSVSVIYVAM